MDPVDNPYSPGAGRQPPALMGPDALIDGFGTSLRRAMARRPDKSMLPIGLRGVGKTVLLNRFEEIAKAEGIHTTFLEATEDGDFKRVLATHLRKLGLDLGRNGMTEAVQRLLGVLEAVRVQDPNGYTWQLDVQPLVGHGDSGFLTEDLTELMVAVGEAVASRSSGFLLLIDELQYLPTEEFAALIGAVHRTTQLALPVVLVGAGLPQVPGRAGEARSYAERLFSYPRIGELERDDALAALRIPAQNVGADFRDDALDQIFSEAHGYPYFLQEWGYNVWNFAADSTFTVADVEVARPEVVRRLDEDFFRVRFDRLTPKEREYLRAMADLGPGPHRSGDIAARLRVKVESVGPRRSILIQKGMIWSPAHGDTAFSVPLFDEYMKRKMPTWCSSAP